MKQAFVNCIILDGTETMQPKSGLAVLCDGEKIEAIVPDSGDFSGYKIIDLGGKYLMPGFVNLHVHLPASGKPKKKQSDPKKLVKLVTSCDPLRAVARKICEGYAKLQLLGGSTTIRTVGGVENHDSAIRDDIAAGKMIGPRILAGNMAVSVPGGHMAGSLAYSATSAEEARAYVEKIAQDKPDIIKLMVTGGVLDAKAKGEPGELKMPADYVKAACDEAHKRGFKVAAHVESPEGVRVALENGVDTIEHGAKPDEYIIKLFKERGAAHVATISPSLPFAMFSLEESGCTEMEQYNGTVVFEGIIDCAKECLANGIPVGLGTDTGCPYVAHYDMWREVNYFHKYCGVSKEFALYTGTLGNAKIAGIDNITGSIEVGKCADFIVTEKNPLDDLTVMRKLSMVVARGNVVENPSPKKYKNVEKALDRYV